MLLRKISNICVKMATVQQKARLWFHESKPIVTSQIRFRLEYRNCRSPSKNFINVGMRNGKEQEMCISEGDFLSLIAHTNNWNSYLETDNFDTLTE
ncbi:hypothetical protein AVEN_67640-1 [Araneus ventricosus]|uniref:DUF4817 domain-containing protein n=1 Tax=Araneus ventricosus TaxID=182803 RepID=A0A4Y2IBJ4_ARAVE|nr:hypothetical protein AVEN_67640-1 [Araneus ventricosus]